MRFTLSGRAQPSDDKERRSPGYLFGGRVRTSTVVLIVAFLAVWWLYDTYRPEPAAKPPAPQVVPPGFVPDPDYTWVPRTRVQPPPTPTPTVPPPADDHDSAPALRAADDAVPAAAALLPAQHHPDRATAAGAAAGARSGAHHAATCPLTWLASENHRYTGVP